MKKAKHAPAPRVMLCVGLKSSGSTWLYNVVIAVLKQSSRGTRNALAAFYADNFAMFPPGADARRYLVVKSHEPSAAILFLNTLTRGRLFVTVREPRDSVASLMLRFGHSFESALKDVSAESKRIAELVRTRRALILRYEDRFHEKEQTIARVAAELGVKLPAAARRRIFDALTREAVKKKIETLKHKGTFGTNPDEFDPATHWHPGHVGDGRVGKYDSVLSPAQQRRIAAATKDYCRAFGYRMKIAGKRRAGR